MVRENVIVREGLNLTLDLTMTVATVLLLTLAVVSWKIWSPSGGENVIIMWVPIAILEWSFAGAMVSVLFRLAYRRGIHAVNLELYTWVVAKPFIGLSITAPLRE